MRGTNVKAKANAAAGIPELIVIAVGKHFRTNKEDKGIMCFMHPC